MDNNQYEQDVSIQNESIKEELLLDAQKASKTLRLANGIIDTTVIIILLTFWDYFVIMIQPSEWVAHFFAFSGTLFSYFAYYLLMETYFQKTIGKFFTGTKVVTLQKEEPYISDIFVKTLCRLIPLDQLSFLFFNNGFHDRFSKTMVIKDKKNALK